MKIKGAITKSDAKFWISIGAIIFSYALTSTINYVRLDERVYAIEDESTTYIEVVQDIDSRLESLCDLQLEQKQELEYIREVIDANFETVPR